MAPIHLFWHEYKASMNESSNYGNAILLISVTWGLKVHFDILLSRYQPFISVFLYNGGAIVAKLEINLR